jgi:hypothetical protein
MVEADFEANWLRHVLSMGYFLQIPSFSTRTTVVDRNSVDLLTSVLVLKPDLTPH